MQNNEMKILMYLLVCILGTLVFVHADTAVNSAHPRECYSCEGVNCQRTSQLNLTSICTDLLDICITVFDNYAVAAKGCYLDMPEYHRRKCDGHNPECFKCFGQLCNNKAREDFKCIDCNDNTKCVGDTSAMIPVQCSIPTAPNSYCFIRKISDGRTQRGCLAHVHEQMKCLNDNSCSMCLSNDGIACNSYQIDIGVSSAAKSSASNPSLGWIALLLSMKYLLQQKF